MALRLVANPALDFEAADEQRRGLTVVRAPALTRPCVTLPEASSTHLWAAEATVITARTAGLRCRNVATAAARPKQSRRGTPCNRRIGAQTRERGKSDYPGARSILKRRTQTYRLAFHRRRRERMTRVRCSCARVRLAQQLVRLVTPAAAHGAAAGSEAAGRPD